MSRSRGGRARTDWDRCYEAVRHCLRVLDERGVKTIKVIEFNLMVAERYADAMKDTGKRVGRRNGRLHDQMNRLRIPISKEMTRQPWVKGDESIWVDGIDAHGMRHQFSKQVRVWRRVEDGESEPGAESEVSEAD